MGKSRFEQLRAEPCHVDAAGRPGDEEQDHPDGLGLAGAALVGIEVDEVGVVGRTEAAGEVAADDAWVASAASG